MSTSIYFSRIAAVFLALVLSTLGIAHAITNGESDDANTYSYVAMIVFGDVVGGGFVPKYWCSGSLIAPNAVLTAGHCTSDFLTGELPKAAQVWFDPHPTWGTWDPQTNPTCAGEEGFPCVGEAAANYNDNMILTHPNFRVIDTETFFLYHDVGVVVLDTYFYDKGFVELPYAGQVDDLANKTDIEVVGYGDTYQAQIPGNLLPSPPPNYRWTGGFWRHYAMSEMVSGEFSWSSDKMRLTRNPGGGTGGIGPGDSGGPSLLADSNIVLAVHSYSNNWNRTGVGYESRVDIPDVLEWINTFLP